MSTKRFCDACEDELDGDNTVGRAHEIEHAYQITGAQFQFRVTFGSNVNGSRIIQGDGDLCIDCLDLALMEYLVNKGRQPDADPDAGEENTEAEDELAEAFEEPTDDEETE